MFAAGFLGMAALLLIAVFASTNRRAIRLRTVGLALALQVAIGALVLYVPLGRRALEGMAHGVDAVLASGKAGIHFLFGNLVNFSVDGIGFVFALNVLPLVVFFSALIAVLYYLGIMQVVIRIIGGAMARLLGTSQTESMSAVANVFVGQSEAPLVVKPYMPKMSDSEFFAVMCGGMASVSGTVLAGYAMMRVDMQYLLAASFMAAPGGILFVKLIIPETSQPDYVFDNSIQFDGKKPENVLAAAGEGASSGLKLAAAIGAMLIAKKLVVNEFVAYSDLAPYLKDASTVTAAGLQVLEEKSKVIISFALCGFANLASMGILIGGLGTLCPSRTDSIARYGLRTVLAATCSNLMSAAIAGVFFSLA
ncbi:NupC/NupG family nucleoside CNT transporter [Aeromonas caviae]|uniref:NupC/NupG family nucleoside CNT transporter n=1 Tax=Aeromonas caviae TaxID=648 RepID=UPI0038D0577F